MRAYSQDLRKRVVECYLNGEGTQEEIASRFCVSRGTVQGWLKLHQEKGSLLPSDTPRGPSSFLTEKAQKAILDLYRTKPDSTLDEYALIIYQKTGLTVSRSTVCRALQKLNLTRKKNAISHRKTRLSGFGRTI
jgi:transposase